MHSFCSGVSQTVPPLQLLFPVYGFAWQACPCVTQHQMFRLWAELLPEPAEPALPVLPAEPADALDAETAEPADAARDRTADAADPEETSDFPALPAEAEDCVHGLIDEPPPDAVEPDEPALTDDALADECEEPADQLGGGSQPQIWAASAPGANASATPPSNNAARSGATARGPFIISTDARGTASDGRICRRLASHTHTQLQLSLIPRPQMQLLGP